MNKERIYIDMDGVIADLHYEWVLRYNNKYQDNLKVEDITTWNFHEIVKCGNKIYEFLDEPDLFLSLPVIENSQEVIKELTKNYDIYIATAPFNHKNIKPKYEWLQLHFPFIPEKNYVFARDKSILSGEYLIDDKVENLIGFKGKGLLFSVPHNYSENNFTRVNGWLEVLDYFNKEMNK